MCTVTQVKHKQEIFVIHQYHHIPAVILKEQDKSSDSEQQPKSRKLDWP